MGKWLEKRSSFIFYYLNVIAATIALRFIFEFAQKLGEKLFILKCFFVRNSLKYEKLILIHYSIFRNNHHFQTQVPK